MFREGRFLKVKSWKKSVGYKCKKQNYKIMQMPIFFLPLSFSNSKSCFEIKIRRFNEIIFQKMYNAHKKKHKEFSYSPMKIL